VALFLEGVTKSGSVWKCEVEAFEPMVGLPRNLLGRLRDYEGDALIFMENEHVALTNNFGENDIRMTNVQPKISGCFRSIEGAKIFCRIRSYLSTCRKQGIKASHALDLVFNGKLPEFVK
jgi:transposase